MSKQRSQSLAFVLVAGALVLLAVAALGYWISRPVQSQIETPADGYLFCFWNVQDLFDDHDDHRTGEGDREVDGWFAHDQAVREQKLEHLSEALARMNAGRGPDVVALAEVESVRAAELLKETLNKRLNNDALRYQHVLMKEVSAGRHIAPAIITRLPVAGDRTRLLGRNLRIVEGHIIVNDHDLVVVASHWTSRLTDKNGARREKYGGQIYGEFRAMYTRNPKVDLLVCGDFNDSPESPSVVKNLRATGDLEAVRQSTRENPRLLDLFAGKEPSRYGTHYYEKEHRWFIFDQIAVSPGLLDQEGWSCDPGSAQAVRDLTADRRGHPWSFGNARARGQRGYSDHFPVTVRLKVN